MPKNKKEFSKMLLIQESALIWIVTLGFLVLAYICIFNEYLGSLPWLTAMASFPWAAYGVSQVYYYKKATVENSKDGIKFETVLAEMSQSINLDSNSTEVISNEEINIWGPIN